MIKDFFILSLNSMKKRKLRSWLTLLGIFIGIAAVVSLISLGDGLRTAITGQFGALSADTLTIQNAETGFGPPGSTAIKKLNDHDLKLIESTKGVKIVIPRLIRVAGVEYNKEVKYGYLGSLPEDKTSLDFVYTNLNTDPQIGRLMTLSDHGKVVLGSNFAPKDYYGKEIQVGSKLLIQGKTFQVAGILKPGSSVITNGVILMFENDMKNIQIFGVKYLKNILSKNEKIIYLYKLAEVHRINDNFKEAQKVYLQILLVNPSDLTAIVNYFRFFLGRKFVSKTTKLYHVITKFYLKSSKFYIL